MPSHRHALTALVLLILALPVRAAEWPVAVAFGPGEAAAEAVREFAAAVRRESGGALALKPPSAPVSAAKVLPALASGEAAVGVFPLSALEGGDAVLAMDRIPFLTTNPVDARKLWQVLSPRVEQVLSARGLTLLFAVPGPPPAPLSRRALVSLAAWQGARMLVDVPGLEPLAKRLGAKAITGNDARAALAGDADVVFRSASAAGRDAAWEYASHYVHAPAWYPKLLVVVRREALTRLARTTRDRLLTLADAAGENAWQDMPEVVREGVQQLRDRGIRAVSPTVELLIGLEGVGRELLFLWSESAGEAGVVLVERYYAVR